MDNRIFKILFYLTLGLNVFLIVSYLVYPIVGDDSGFYIAAARELYSGKIYFKELGISYNPLSIIVFGFPYLFADHPGYGWHLAMNILFVLSASVIFYNILKLLYTPKVYNLLFASFFVLLSLVLDGKDVMLEPVSVFFQLSAFYLYLSYINKPKLSRVFFVGLFISLAFLSKQYGLFIAVPIGVDLLWRSKMKIKDLSSLALGFLIPLTIFFLYLFYYGMSFPEFINYVLGKGVTLDIGNGTGIATSFFTYPLDFVYVIIFNLYVILIPFLLIKYYNKLDNRKTLIILAALLSLSVLIFANYWHYYQYIVPFWIILFVYLFQNSSSRKFKILVALTFAVSISFIGMHSVLSFQRKKQDLNKQQMVSTELSRYIPHGSEVYLDGLSPSYYYVCHLRSINLRMIGFSFPGYFYPKTIVNYLKPGAFLVVSEPKVDNYAGLLSDCEINKVELNNQVFFIIRKQGSNVEN